MAQMNKIIGVLGVLLSLLFLAGCSSPTPTSAPTSAPTLDLNPLRTEVAGTVFAQVTRDLGLTPSPTPAPSVTPTLRPSATPIEVASPTQTTGPSPEASPSATPAQASATPEQESQNRAEWVSQSVPDDTVFGPGETFTMTWRLRNVGNTTWTTGYLLRFYSGDPFGAPKEVPIPNEVPPGETVDITLAMKAPTRPGTYQSVWVMSTEARSNFKEPVYLQIIVAVTPTPTRTAIPTATPTP